ncbi:MAG: DOMON-like domain-containing protein [Dissulfurispiraceae bacterium]
MNEQIFALQPFSPSNGLSDLQMRGKIARHSNKMVVHYALLGHLSEVIIQTPAAMPVRKTALWQETCFELFLAFVGSSRYWEFNLSPSGDWNVYRFDSHRQGMEEELTFTALPVSVLNKSHSLLLSLEFNLDRIGRANQAMEVAICAVIKHKDDGISYWALTHGGPQIDFHKRENFIIEL